MKKIECRRKSSKQDFVYTLRSIFYAPFCTLARLMTITEIFPFSVQNIVSNGVNETF